jgi:hypothetical protein
MHKALMMCFHDQTGRQNNAYDQKESHRMTDVLLCGALPLCHVTSLAWRELGTSNDKSYSGLDYVAFMAWPL